MPREGEEVLTRARVPELRCPVGAAGGQALAVGIEAHAGHLACVPLEGEQFLTRARVPQLGSAVPAAGGQALAVGAETGTVHPTCMLREGKEAPTGGTLEIVPFPA